MDKDRLISRRRSLPNPKPQPINTVAPTSIPIQHNVSRSPTEKAMSKAADIANLAAAKPRRASAIGGYSGRAAQAIAAAGAFEPTPTVPAPLRAASSGGAGSNTAARLQPDEREPTAPPAGGPRTPERPLEPFGARAGCCIGPTSGRPPAAQSPEPRELLCPGLAPPTGEAAPGMHAPEPIRLPDRCFAKYLLLGPEKNGPNQGKPPHAGAPRAAGPRPAPSPEPPPFPAAAAAAGGGALSAFQADLADILGMISRASASPAAVLHFRFAKDVRFAMGPRHSARMRPATRTGEPLPSQTLLIQRI